MSLFARSSALTFASLKGIGEKSRQKNQIFFLHICFVKTGVGFSMIGNGGVCLQTVDAGNSDSRVPTSRTSSLNISISLNRSARGWHRKKKLILNEFGFMYKHNQLSFETFSHVELFSFFTHSELFKCLPFNLSKTAGVPKSNYTAFESWLPSAHYAHRA